MKGILHGKIRLYSIDDTNNRRYVCCTQLKTSAIKCKGLFFFSHSFQKIFLLHIFIKKEKKDLERQREQKFRIKSTKIFFLLKMQIKICLLFFLLFSFIYKYTNLKTREKYKGGKRFEKSGKSNRRKTSKNQS